MDTWYGCGSRDTGFLTRSLPRRRPIPWRRAMPSISSPRNRHSRRRPHRSVPEQDEEETPAVNGKNVYLCLKAGETAAQLLDVLDSAGEKASFFCSLEFLWTQGDLLRRMSASGHTVGILGDGEDSRSVTQQLHEGNEALWRAACTKPGWRIWKTETARTCRLRRKTAFGAFTRIWTADRTACPAQRRPRHCWSALPPGEAA